MYSTLDVLSNLEDARRTGVEFLITDLKAAITFTEIALNSTNDHTVERNRRNALKAWRVVQSFIARTPLEKRESDAISALFAVLKEKLALLGATAD